MSTSIGNAPSSSMSSFDSSHLITASLSLKFSSGTAQVAPYSCDLSTSISIDLSDISSSSSTSAGTSSSSIVSSTSLLHVDRSEERSETVLAVLSSSMYLTSLTGFPVLGDSKKCTVLRSGTTGDVVIVEALLLISTRGRLIGIGDEYISV